MVFIISSGLIYPALSYGDELLAGLSLGVTALKVNENDYKEFHPEYGLRMLFKNSNWIYQFALSSSKRDGELLSVGKSEIMDVSISYQSDSKLTYGIGMMHESSIDNGKSLTSPYLSLGMMHKGKIGWYLLQANFLFPENYSEYIGPTSMSGDLFVFNATFSILIGS